MRSGTPAGEGKRGFMFDSGVKGALFSFSKFEHRKSDSRVNVLFYGVNGGSRCACKALLGPSSTLAWTARSELLAYAWPTP